MQASSPLPEPDQQGPRRSTIAPWAPAVSQRLSSSRCFCVREPWPPAGALRHRERAAVPAHVPLICWPCITESVGADSVVVAGQRSRCCSIRRWRRRRWRWRAPPVPAASASWPGWCARSGAPWATAQPRRGSLYGQVEGGASIVDPGRSACRWSEALALAESSGLRAGSATGPVPAAVSPEGDPGGGIPGRGAATACGRGPRRPSPRGPRGPGRRPAPGASG